MVLTVPAVSLQSMRQNFRARISFDGQSVTATILPEHRKDGIYYEVNIPNYPRFYMHLSAADRYDITDNTLNIPDALLLAISDVIEEKTSH